MPVMPPSESLGVSNKNVWKGTFRTVKHYLVVFSLYEVTVPLKSLVKLQNFLKNNDIYL